MAISISLWKRDFLQRRNLEQVTGMPLYSYKMSSQEFDDLEALLKERLITFLNYANLSDLSRHLPPFPGLFVIYAAEWWRRRYAGSGWEWEPILVSLGLPSHQWSPNERSECVEKGLKDWGLKLVDARGLRYLSSIAFQGGLPMQLLATSRGNIGRVLTKVLKIATKGNFEASDIQDWIRSLSNDLPKAYRQNEIYVLLAEVVLSVLKLIRDANLTSPIGALEKLDSSNPNWRNSFPLPIEDKHAQGLIDQLIRDAANVKISKTTIKLKVLRWLECSEGNWEFQSDITLPDFLDTSEIKSQFNLDEFETNRQLTLRIVRGNKVTEISLRKLAGQERYKLEQKPIEIHDISASAEHQISIINSDGQVFHSAILNGNAMSSSLPWLFEVAELENKFSLIRQGGGSIVGNETIICIPIGWRVITESENEAQKLGDLKIHNRIVWKIFGNATISDLSNNTFRVRCGQASASEDLLELRGVRIWELFSRPSVAFSGTPKLFKVTENGLSHPVSSPIGWRNTSGTISETKNSLYGPVDAYWPANSEIKWHTRFVQLPENAKLIVIPGDNPNIGRLHFSNWKLLNAHTENPDIRITSNLNENDLILDLNYIGNGYPPEWCEITATWPSNAVEASLKIPFPSKGVRAIDAHGNQIPNKYQMPIGNILGVRLLGFLGSAKRAELSISLLNVGSSNANYSFNKIIKTMQDQTTIEIRLLDYSNEINKLLAGIDTLDAFVSFELKIVGAPPFSIRLAKYACELTRLPTLPGVEIPQSILDKFTPENLSDISVYILRLDAPGDEPIKLEPIFSEGVNTGRWPIPNHLSAGPWMIYPDESSHLNFRPLIWPIIDQGQFNDEPFNKKISLSNALKISDLVERNRLLDEVVKILSNDFLNHDWLLVAQLASNLGHLPLSTLDLWRSFTHFPKAMAALAIRTNDFKPNFIDRFSAELPWMWETISLNDWTDAIQLLLNQCETQYGIDAAKIVFSSYLERRVQDICTQNPALRILLEVAKTQVSGVSSPEISLLRNNFMEKTNADLLFTGEDSRLQKLLRNNAESTWPNYFSEIRANMKQGEFSIYLCPESYDSRNAIINTPIVLAISSVMNIPINQNEDPDFMRKLRIMNDFDQDWFSEAFDLTVARCISTGLIYIK